MKELYVVNCCRTAVGSFGGSLKNTPAAQLGSIVVKEALKRANVAPGDSDVVVCGGTENMSAAPYAAPDARWGARMGDKKFVDTMIKDGL